MHPVRRLARLLALLVLCLPGLWPPTALADSATLPVPSVNPSAPALPGGASLVIPPFCDLSPAERASLINWPGIVEHCSFLPVMLRP